jgi:hypothetical protein
MSLSLQEDVRSEESNTANELEEERNIFKGLHKSSAQLSRLVFHVVIPQRMKQPSLPPWLLEECHDYFNTIFDDAMDKVDFRMRRNIIINMCGDGDHGVVLPTQWPLPTHQGASSSEAEKFDKEDD